jgi:hypothetical protein
MEHAPAVVQTAAATPCSSPCAQELVLASAERITRLVPIADADWLQLATVRGMCFVVSKHEFEVGCMCIFFRPTALLPRHVAEFAFMRGRPVRAKVIRGQLSEGLLGPMWWYSSKVIRDTLLNSNFEMRLETDLCRWSKQCEAKVLEGSDMTRILGVRPSAH